jgi:putative transposase
MTDEVPYSARKRIRLDRNLYAEPGRIISVTVTTRDRRPVFEHDCCTRECLEILERTASDHDFNVLVYCFMPNHLHLLLENKGGDLITFTRHFKSWSTRAAWRHGWHGQLWQRSYYDHILREDEDIASHIRYILNNPIRHGLVESWTEYRWSGSLAYDLSDPADWPL